MARRSQKELLIEFHRLCDVFEVLFDIEVEFDLAAEEERKFLISRSRYLELVENKEATLSQCISGIKQGINDLINIPRDASDDELKMHTRVLSLYREKTDRELFSDIEDPHLVAKKTVKHGKIRNDGEYHILKEILSVVDQTLFDSATTERVEDMLAIYETNATAKL